MIIQTHYQVESPQLTAVKDKLLTLSAKSVSGFKKYHEELREAMAERKTMKGLKHSEVREAKRFGDWIYYRGMRNPNRKRNPMTLQKTREDELMDKAARIFAEVTSRPLKTRKPTKEQLERWDVMEKEAGYPFDVSEKERDRLFKKGIVV